MFTFQWVVSISRFNLWNHHRYYVMTIWTFLLESSIFFSIHSVHPLKYDLTVHIFRHFFKILWMFVFHRGIVRKDSIWDKFVFQKIQAGLGGRVRLITTGSAPLSPKVLSFLRCCVGCPVSIKDVVLPSRISLIPPLLYWIFLNY